MYSDKENVNLLTALLLQHGIATAVVCPGSRNAPIVHNLHEAGLRCVPVTDERSAGFYALGLALALRQPVVVCVTSGSALLNLAPAVAEAAYRHVPLILVSADRPPERIGQLDAQTLPQEGALGDFVAMSVSLPEPSDDVGRLHCNRMANEALLEAQRPPHRPVHINVPITEPLFRFTAAQLPRERVIRRIPAGDGGAEGAVGTIVERLNSAERPMIVVGQCESDCRLDRFISAFSPRVALLCEPLSHSLGGLPFDDVLAAPSPGLAPDYLLYIGGSLVSKRLKLFLQNAPGLQTWLLTRDGQAHDTFRNLAALVDAPSLALLSALADKAAEVEPKPFRDLWQQALAAAARRAGNSLPPYSEEMAVRLFEEMLAGSPAPCHVHYANSTAVRLACRHARHYIYVNRGVNGIEGSLSTAAGFSLAAEGRTFCVTGDLSFFYDSNALWNAQLDGRLRILLLNNGGGAIFRTLPGLEQSPVRDKFVMAAHRTSAEGLCAAYGVRYLRAANEAQLRSGMAQLIAAESSRPLLLEAFFD